MQRNAVRVVFVIIVLATAIWVPLVSSGYSELSRASTAQSYLEVAKHYKNAAQRIPWRPDLYELSGHAYYYAKEYALADAVYQQAYRRNGLSAQGWVAWGDVVYLDHDEQRATQIWEQALEQKDPSEDLYSRLSQTYQENGNYSKAAEYLQRYVALNLDDASAHYRLGLLLTLTDPDAALSELINASQLDPQFDSAVETLRSALNLASIDDSPSARLVLIGRGLALVQAWDLARLQFESAIEADSGNAEAWAWLGEAKQQADAALSVSNGDDGSAELEQAFKLNPNSATVRGLRGLYFQRVGNHRSALTEFQAAANLDDKNPAWQVSIGETFSKLGDLIEARRAYENAVELAPEDPGYWRLLAVFCAQNNVNIKDVGLPAAQKAVVIDPEDAISQDTLGWLLLLDARYDEAERILVHALELDPQNASTQLHLGMLYFQTGNRASAYDHFVKARDLGSSDAQAILNQYFP